MATQGERRLTFQKILESILPNVYFQPPTGMQIVYPCIVYERDREYKDWADNLPYHKEIGYQVTLISRDPDDPAWDVLDDLPKSSFNRHYAKDGLNHDVFEIYF